MSWLGSLAGGLGGLLGKASGLLSNPLVNVAAHLTGAGLLTDTINGANALMSSLNGSSGYSDAEKLLIAQTLTNNNSQGQTASTTYAEDAAAQDSIDAAEAEARTNTQSAVNNGINKSKAGMLGEHQANSALTDSYADRYSGYKTQGASTQADYLKSQGQMFDTYNQLNNARKGVSAATRYGALSGAASGASLGLSVSDENNKESPETNIIDLIRQFVDLTNRVNELRKENE